MSLKIMISGTGGQGILFTTRLLTGFFVGRGRKVVTSQIHGMSQRGGSVQSSVLVDAGDSPVIGRGDADILLGFEPVETVRALDCASARTAVFMNTTPVIPFVLSQQYVQKQGPGTYPDLAALGDTIRKVTPSLFQFDATTMARDAGSSKSLNLVMTGCLFGTGIIPGSAGDFETWFRENGNPGQGEPNLRAWAGGVALGKRLNPVEQER